MRFFKEIIKCLLEADTSEQPSTPPPKDKFVAVKHNGRQKVYRINKYGELFELKR